MPFPLHLSKTFSEYISARTRFFDEQVLDATQASACQVVILGAGYDDRALRFRTSGIRFVEVDHPHTQRDKIDRLRRLGITTDHITFLSADFTNDDLAHILASKLTPNAPTVLLCEGLIPYLTPETVESLLQQAASCPGTQRHLVAELPIRPTTGRGRLVLRMLGFGTAITGERIRTVFASGEAAKRTLASAGWKIELWQPGQVIGMPPATRDLAYAIAIS
jgi:methyltransferase (TIGR00027 family)